MRYKHTTYLVGGPTKVSKENISILREALQPTPRYMTNKKCLIDNECDGSCQAYNPKAHICSIFKMPSDPNPTSDITRTASIEEEFGPQQIKAELNAQTTSAANALLSLHKIDPKAYEMALMMADVVIKETLPK